MTTAKINLHGICEFNGGTLRVDPTEMEIASPKAQHFVMNLVAGDTEISLPGVYLAIIVPPPDNTAVLKLKGAAGDTGIKIHSSHWCALTLNGSPTPTNSIIINASTLVTSVELYYF